MIPLSGWATWPAGKDVARGRYSTGGRQGPGAGLYLSSGVAGHNLLVHSYEPSPYILQVREIWERRATVVGVASLTAT